MKKKEIEGYLIRNGNINCNPGAFTYFIKGFFNISLTFLTTIEN